MNDPEHPGPDHAHLALMDRISRLEESQAFGERSVDVLREQIDAIERRLAELGDRCRRLEASAKHDADGAPDRSLPDVQQR